MPHRPLACTESILAYVSFSLKVRHTLHENEQHARVIDPSFFFLCFFTLHCYAVTHCRGPWIPGPLKFLSPADSPLSSRINISDATVKPYRPLEFYRKVVNLFILNRFRTSENVKTRRIDVRKRTKIIRMARNKNILGHVLDIFFLEKRTNNLVSSILARYFRIVAKSF